MCDKTMSSLHPTIHETYQKTVFHSYKDECTKDFSAFCLKSAMRSKTWRCCYDNGRGLHRKQVQSSQDLHMISERKCSTQNYMLQTRMAKLLVEKSSEDHPQPDRLPKHSMLERTLKSTTQRQTTGAKSRKHESSLEPTRLTAEDTGDEVQAGGRFETRERDGVNQCEELIGPRRIRMRTLKNSSELQNPLLNPLASSSRKKSRSSPVKKSLETRVRSAEMVDDEQCGESVERSVTPAVETRIEREIMRDTSRVYLQKTSLQSSQITGVSRLYQKSNNDVKNAGIFGISHSGEENDVSSGVGRRAATRVLRETKQLKMQVSTAILQSKTAKEVESHHESAWRAKDEDKPRQETRLFQKPHILLPARSVTETLEDDAIGSLLTSKLPELEELNAKVADLALLPSASTPCLESCAYSSVKESQHNICPDPVQKTTARTKSSPSVLGNGIGRKYSRVELENSDSDDISDFIVNESHVSSQEDDSEIATPSPRPPLRFTRRLVRGRRPRPSDDSGSEKEEVCDKVTINRRLSNDGIMGKEGHGVASVDTDGVSPSWENNKNFKTPAVGIVQDYKDVLALKPPNKQ